MPETITVDMGSVKVAHNPATLSTMGVGSCIVVVIFDPQAHVGGLAHAMLPAAPAVHRRPSPLASRYVDAAIEELVTQLVLSGASRSRLQAKIVGGAHMFALYGSSETGVGSKNVHAARTTLAAARIPITAEETGGSVGRNVHFDVATGICSVETKM